MLAVGGTFAICTTAAAVAVSPPASRTSTWTVGVAGPSGAAKLTVLPGVSKVPLSSKSHAYVSAPPSGSLPVAPTCATLPSSTENGPSGATDGGWFTDAAVVKLQLGEPSTMSGGSLAS